MKHRYIVAHTYPATRNWSCAKPNYIVTDEDHRLIESFRAKGLHPAREVNRSHILAALDRGITESQITVVPGAGKAIIWRTRSAYFGQIQ